MLVSRIYLFFLITPFCVLKQGNVKLQTSQEHDFPTGGAVLKKTKEEEEEEERGGGLQTGSGSDSIVLQRGKFKLDVEIGINLLVIKHDTTVMLSLNEMQVSVPVYLLFYWQSFVDFLQMVLFIHPSVCSVLCYSFITGRLFKIYFLQCMVVFKRHFICICGFVISPLFPYIHQFFTSIYAT